MSRYGSAVALIGWGDESGSDVARDPGTYLISVVLAEQSAAAEIQEAMALLRFKGAAKLHWRDEVPARRRLIAGKVSQLPASGLVVVRSDPDSTEPLERRRRKCLEHLLPLLAEHDCGHLILESRGSRDDHRDRQMLDYLRRAHRLRRRLHVDHVPGPKDPALWAADAVCGALVSDRVGEPGYLAMITARMRVEIVTI